jgi:RNA polymerase sigma factor (sigma-70 family)
MASALVKRHRNHVPKAEADRFSDEILLERFLNAQEPESQEAFGALVERHGPMVLGICRHILCQQQDAEDAFQATFLVLAQKGASIRNRRVLAGWLHEVAHRIAVKARTRLVRRRSLERQSLAMSPPALQPNDQDQTAAWNELRPVLHAEVDRLPERYRIPVILSYLEGKTNEEVAALLRWPVGTVKGRLSRARDLLRSRLMRRGLTLSAAFLMTALSQGTVFAEVVPGELITRTVRLARKFGPRGGSNPLLDPEPQPPIEAVGPSPLKSATAFKPQRLRFPRRQLGLILLAVLSSTIATGALLAMLGHGGAQAAFSAFIPSGVAGFSNGGSCH